MSPMRPASVLLAASVAALLVGGCGTSSSSGGGGGGSGRPQPSAPGTPIGDPTTDGVGTPGGVLASTDGFLVIEVPAGALPAATQVTVQEVTNLAPGGVGAAWKLGPEGTSFAKPVALTFYAGPIGRPVDELTVAF